MLRQLAQLRGTAQLARLGNALQGMRSVAVSAEGSAVSEGKATSSREDSKAGTDNRPRYLVADQHPGDALELLAKSFYRTPVISPLAGGGAKTRYLKLPPPQVCSKVLGQAAAEPKLVLQAAELAEALMLQGIELAPSSLQALVVGLTRRGKVSLALAPLDRWLAAHSEELESAECDTGVRADALAMLSGLLDSAARGEDTVMVQQVLTRMAKVGLMPDERSITSLLQCFMRLGQPQIAHSILEWMRRGGMQPNIYHYTTLMAMTRDLDTSGAAKQLQQAQQSYEQMQEDGVRPNTRFYTAFIRLCGRARDLHAAMQIWQDMEALGVKPDLFLYSALIDTCAKCQAADTALQLFESMKASRMRPDIVIYSSLLTALQGSPARTSAARRVWADMRSSRVEPNSFAVAAYLDILLTEGEFDEALQLLTEATQQLAAVRGGGQASEGQLLRLYEHFMSAMAHKGQHSVVEHLARHLRSRGLRHTLGTAAALLTSQAMQRPAGFTGRWLLHQLDCTQLEDTHQKQHQQAQHEGSASQGPSAQQPHPSQQQAQQAQQQGGAGTASRQLLNLPEELVDSCLLGKRSAEEYVRGVMAAGGRRHWQAQGLLSTAAVNMMLGGLAVQGHPATAFELYDWAQLEGFRPDAATLRLLMLAALNASPDTQVDLLVRVLADARQHASTARHARNGPQQQQRQWRRGGGSLWCHRTHSAILAALRQSNRARELLSDTEGAVQSGEESEAQMRKVLAMLGQR